MTSQINIEGVKKIADTFTRLADARDAAPDHSMDVRMLQTYIAKQESTEAHPCRTVACHAGWYAYARTTETRWENPVNGEERLIDAEGNPVTFSDGMDLLAIDAGFEFAEGEPGDALAEWAHRNPDQWGNPFGREMFGSVNAFLKPGFVSIPLPDLRLIADHWQGVYKRLAATGETT